MRTALGVQLPWQRFDMSLRDVVQKLDNKLELSMHFRIAVRIY